MHEVKDIQIQQMLSYRIETALQGAL